MHILGSGEIGENQRSPLFYASLLSAQKKVEEGDARIPIILPSFATAESHLLAIDEWGEG